MNNQNSHWGVLPSGYFGRNTRIDYCCRFVLTSFPWNNCWLLLRVHDENISLILSFWHPFISLSSNSLESGLDRCSVIVACRTNAITHSGPSLQWWRLYMNFIHILYDQLIIQFSFHSFLSPYICYGRKLCSFLMNQIFRSSDLILIGLKTEKQMVWLG